jgi:UrcA family protein
MKLFHSTAIALLIVTGTTTAVFAGETAKNSLDKFYIKTATVSFADLDLANPEDAATLLERIEKTSMKVCRAHDGLVGTEKLIAARHCFTDSYKNGVAAINSKKNLDIEAVAARATSSRDVVAAD